MPLHCVLSFDCNLTATGQLSLPLPPSVSFSLSLTLSPSLSRSPLSLSPLASGNKRDQGTHVAHQHETHAYKRRRFSPWEPKPPFVPSVPAGPGDPAPPPGADPIAHKHRHHTQRHTQGTLPCRQRIKRTNAPTGGKTRTRQQTQRRAIHTHTHTHTHTKRTTTDNDARENEKARRQERKRGRERREKCWTRQMTDAIVKGLNPKP